MFFFSWQEFSFQPEIDFGTNMEQIYVSNHHKLEPNCLISQNYKIAANFQSLTFHKIFMCKKRRKSMCVKDSMIGERFCSPWNEILMSVVVAPVDVVVVVEAIYIVFAAFLTLYSLLFQCLFFPPNKSFSVAQEIIPTSMEAFQ